MTPILEEAKRLYRLGWAVHWIKPNSKAPVKPGWSGDTRDDWATVKADYRKGYGLGVRMGKASKIDGGYLANIDVDVKGGELKYWTQAGKALLKFFPGLPIDAPRVVTGAGFRVFVRTKEPLPSRRLASSPEKVDYFGEQKDAWQLEFMSAGKQVVLPPSIHPETKKPYEWVNPISGRLPLVTIDTGKLGGKEKRAIQDFTPVEVDLVGSTLPDHIVDMILDGDRVDDRSAACLTVGMAMCRAGLSDAEIISVLTDRGTYLGKTAYDHRNTGSRRAAAAWVRDYVVAKARKETDAAAAFNDVVEVETRSKKTGKRDWRLDLARGGQNGEGAPKPTLENTVLVLSNSGGAHVFKRDLFANRDSYGCDAPWGGKCGEALTDDDAVKIKLWLGRKFNFEPATGTVFEAMVAIATQNAFHPVRDELMALPEWDGQGRIDSWLKRWFGARGPDEYLGQVFRKWLVASVWRVFEPGLKFDWMPILEGNQGTGKSSFGAILFGQRYFTDWLPVLSDKDAALGLQGIRCVEFGELDQLKRNELETTKAFITRQIDKVRPPYGRRQLELHRQCVFFGTTNKSEYLKDETGNRRFNPIKVGKLNFKALERDRDQLWAEALFIYQNRLEPSLYLNNGAEAHAKKAQENKMVMDDAKLMEQQLLAYRESPDENGPELSKFRISVLFEGAGAPLGKWKEDARNIQFAAIALRKLGAKRVKIKGLHWWRMPGGEV